VELRLIVFGVGDLGEFFFFFFFFFRRRRERKER